MMKSVENIQTQLEELPKLLELPEQLPEQPEKKPRKTYKKREPKKPKTSPLFTVKETSFTASKLPNFFERFLTCITG